MGHYTKLAVLLLRAFGVLMVLYGSLMLGLAVVASWLKLGRTSQASDSGSTLFWLGAYLFAGILVLVLARPLGSMIGKSIDDSSDAPPAA